MLSDCVTVWWCARTAGDIGNPAAILQGLQAAGIDTSVQPLLHVRTFLDHDRPYIAPTSEPRATGGVRCPGVYVQPGDGSLLDPALVMRSLAEGWQYCNTDYKLG